MDPRQRLLVVTSDPAYVSYFERPRTDFETVVVRWIADALDALLTGRFAVAILDVHSPGLPAPVVIHVARRVRSDIAILVVSAEPSVGSDAPWVEQGVFYYTAKPCDPAELEHVLAAAGCAGSLRGLWR